jgi:MFS family permease
MRLSDFGQVPDHESNSNLESDPQLDRDRPESETNGNGPQQPTPSPVEEEAAPGGIFSVLKNRNFLTLWGGQIFSQLADKIYLVLTIAIVERQFQAENQTISGWVSAIMMANTIPAVLFGSLAGVFVDRWHKRKVLVSTNLFRGLLVLIIPAILWLTQGRVVANLPLGFELLLLIVFTVSVLTQFFAPAEQAAISLIVEKKNLLSANSLYTTTMMGSLIVGFAVGEPLLTFADALAAKAGLGLNIGKELLVGGSYTIAGLLLFFLKTGESEQLPTGDASHIFQDLKDGIAYLSNHNKIKGALIQIVVLYSVFASMTVLAVRMAEILPEIKASQFGILLSAGGIGMGIGAALLSYFGNKFTLNQLSLFGSIGVAASLITLAISHSLWLTLISLLLQGVFGAMVAIPMQTRIQSETPEDMRGKVFGLQNNLVNIALSLPLALTGIAETALGLPNVLLGLAAIAFAGALFTRNYNQSDS